MATYLLSVQYPAAKQEIALDRIVVEAAVGLGRGRLERHEFQDGKRTIVVAFDQRDTAAEVKGLVLTSLKLAPDDERALMTGKPDAWIEESEAQP